MLCDAAPAVGTPEYITAVYFPVIRPVILEIGSTKLTVYVLLAEKHCISHQNVLLGAITAFGRYFCRFVFNGTVLNADAAAASIGSFWDAFPLTSRVFKGHHDAMNAKSEAVASAAWDVNFIRLCEGLENFSTLGQQLVSSDSVVSLLLVFRDEAFRFFASTSAYIVAAHLACRRPFVLNAKHHSELCRFLPCMRLPCISAF
jgi:hypothetical protein